MASLWLRLALAVLFRFALAMHQADADRSAAMRAETPGFLAGGVFDSSHFQLVLPVALFRAAADHPEDEEHGNDAYSQGGSGGRAPFFDSA